MGVVYVSCGASDIGQGCETMLVQVAADGLGVEQSRVRITTGDTRLTPVDLGAYSSRVTLMCGQACNAAARQLRARLDSAAGLLMGDQSLLPELKDEMYRTATEMVSWLDVVVFEESRSVPLRGYPRHGHNTRGKYGCSIEHLQPIVSPPMWLR